jgi:transmembrane sensor
MKLDERNAPLDAVIVDELRAVRVSREETHASLAAFHARRAAPAADPGVREARIPGNGMAEAIRGLFPRQPLALRRIASGVAMVLVIVAGYVYTGAGRLPTADPLGRGQGVASTSPGRTYTTTAGQQAIITLENGSQAVLGPSTTLVVSEDPATGTTVSMTGQALFTVTHQNRTPFSVRTGKTLTRVLGTSFLVRRYETDNAARVAVVDGRVSVHGIENTSTTDIRIDTGTVLVAGAMAVVSGPGNVHVTSNVPVDDYTAWTTGRLVFRQTPVAEIVEDIGRAYGVDLRVTDASLRQRAFTWTVSVPQLTLNEALNILTAALDARVSRDGGVITIVPAPSAPASAVRPLTFPPPPSHTPQENQYGR